MKSLLLPTLIAAGGIYLIERFCLPSVNPYYVTVMYAAGFNIIMAVSLNVINGFTGHFSLGHAGFMAVGAYASAGITCKHIEALRGALIFCPEPVANSLILLSVLLVGGVCAEMAGLIVGLPTLRLKGDYLAIATLGFGEIIRIIINNIGSLGGGRGLPSIPPLTNFFWTFLCVVVTILTLRNYTRSSHGKALLAIREDELAAEMVGINTTRYKVVAFVMGAFFAGIAGGLFAHYNNFISPNGFDFIQSVIFVVMVVLGGMGSITGSVLAAVFLTALPQFLSPLTRLMETWHLAGDPKNVIYPLLLIVMMLTRPKGLLADKELSWAGVQSVFLRLRRGHAAS